MSLENEIFRQTSVRTDRLLPFGFRKRNGGYLYSEEMREGEYRAELFIDSEGNVTGRVIVTETGEEYLPVRLTGRFSPYVGSIREEFRQILQRIADQCFVKDVFFSPQANRIARLIEKCYGESPDFPFKNFREFGVFRYPVNRKWYGLLGHLKKDLFFKGVTQKSGKNDGEGVRSVKGKRSDVGRKKGVNKREVKNGIGSETARKPEASMIDVLNLKVGPGERDRVLAIPGIYPAYHMNRKNWVSVVLDGTVPDKVVMELIDASRENVIHSGRGILSREGITQWIVPANPTYYDIESAFRQKRVILWKQSSKIRVGDIIYMYVGSPVSAIRYRCVVLQSDIPYDYEDKNIKITKVMKIKLQKTYRPTLFPFSRLKSLGITTVRGPRIAPREFLDAIE